SVEDNTIAFNDSDGVEVAAVGWSRSGQRPTSTPLDAFLGIDQVAYQLRGLYPADHNSIRGNRMHDNGGLGIHLHDRWANDGPGNAVLEDERNNPVLALTPLEDGYRVTGRMVCRGGWDYEIDLYATDADGEGRVRLGSALAREDECGVFTFVVPKAALVFPYL